MDTTNRPQREDFGSFMEYKRAMEFYIYWLSQEESAMKTKLQKVIKKNSEENSADLEAT